MNAASESAQFKKEVKMRYKSKDIAKELGISTATVSLVLNDKPGVSAQRRQEIIDKIRDMGCEYLLKKDVTDKGNVGFVVYKGTGEIVNEYPFFNYLIENINKCMLLHNYKMNILYLERQMTDEKMRQQLTLSQCKGFIVYAVEMSAGDLELFHGLEQPCVFLDNLFPAEAVDTVSIDNCLGVHQAVGHLYEMGHRKLGYIRSKVKIQSFEERFDAFAKALNKKGLALSEEHIIDVGYLESETTRDVMDYLKYAKDLPSAFFADNDLLACHAVQGLKGMGYRVPEEVSVIGFDNRPICSFTDPPVTTVEIPREDMGLAAVERLIDRLEGNSGPSYKTLIGTKLIQRESVKGLKDI